MRWRGNRQTEHLREVLGRQEEELVLEFPWDIGRQGRSWASDQWQGGQVWHERYRLAPGKIESMEGKLFHCEAERLTLLALLQENVGIDKAVRLGDPRVWKEAVAALESAR